ncbi:MAG: signal transduction histidine kinase (STHK), LytS, partial [Oscillatoriales cyanobacterium C42_A2020_001]|nr:signal transduction histidine kinase (STHK), LytS [Leptolyngbyaceae cyanobacterium C42_A2020_001]
IKELLHEANLDTITGSTITLKRGVMVGNLTGGITGLLVGIGLLAVPGVGEVVLGSAFLYLLSTVGVGTLTGGALGALVGQGITERLAKNYADQVIQGNYLLIVNGSESDIFRAEHILYVRGIQSHRWS